MIVSLGKDVSYRIWINLFPEWASEGRLCGLLIEMWPCYCILNDREEKIYLTEKKAKEIVNKVTEGKKRKNVAINFD